MLELSRLAALKSSEPVVADFGRINQTCAAERGAPLTPREFAAQIETKSFTSKKADLALVNRLYEQGFAKRFGAAPNRCASPPDKPAVRPAKRNAEP